MRKQQIHQKEGLSRITPQEENICISREGIQSLEYYN
jgi:hypothetical protein